MISLSDIYATNATVKATNSNSGDLTAPTIKSTDPAGGAANIAVNKVIKVTFSESIKSGTNSIELKTSGGKSVAFTTSINGNTLTIKPKNNLTPGTQYTLLIHSGSVTDLSGNKYLYAGSTTFKTYSTAPTIKSTDPSNSAVNVAVNKVIKVTFSKSIKSGTNSIELKTSSGKSVAFTTSISGSVLTIKPKNNLTPGTQYTLLIHSGSVTDLSGNKYLYAGSTTFKTDGTAPTVKSIDPPSNAVSIAVSKVIKVTFSESIKAGTISINVKNIATGTYIPITTSISGNVLTITPKSNLATSTQYSIILNSNSITDLSGNPLKSYSSKFTTGGSSSFTITQIKNAAASVKSYIETNNRLPNYVTIGTSQVTMPRFLQLLVTSLLQLNNGTSTSISVGNISSPTNSTGSYIYGNLYKSEYISIAKTIKSFINSNNKAPNYVSSSLGNIQYESLIYIYSKILNYYKTNSNLPAYVLVDSSVTNTTVPSSLQQYLQVTANCQVNDSSIKSLAASLTKGKSSAYDKAVAIFNWVRDNTDYVFYSNSHQGAVTTLSKKSGNCCDLTHLLIALERAAGIPARYEHVYAKFSSGTWYGHVIAQVYVNGKWYYADASNNINTFGVIKNWDTTTATIYGTYATLLF
jgi:Transglutaminase-like enzymes, putative cysteine proteases